MNLGRKLKWLYLGMWMYEMREDAEGQVAACRVAAHNEVGWVSTFGFEEVSEKLDGLL